MSSHTAAYKRKKEKNISNPPGGGGGHRMDIAKNTSKYTASCKVLRAET